MAYAALISLRQVIERLLNSSQISIVPPSRNTIKSAYKHVKSLQQVLQRFDSCNASSDRVSALDEETRETVRKFEDVIESHLTNQFLSHQSEESHGDREIHPLILSLETEEQEIDSFIDTVKRLENEFLNELSNGNPFREEDVAVLDGKKSKMIGFSDQFHEIRSRILDPLTPWSTHFYVVGMAGIGKTTLAVEIFRDPLVSSHFDSRAFVKLGQKAELKEVLKGVLAQLNPEIDKMLKEGDVGLNELKGMMHRNLKGKRYLVVLDDVWETQAWKDLGRLLPYNNNGSRLLLTTRLQKLAHSENSYEVRLLNREESWDLLREKVFDEDEVCSAQLEKSGRKIAENCDGLPLLIITVADLLSRSEKTAEYWKKKAANREDSLYIEAKDQMLVSLFSSYEYLPQHLKACFLYMGVFPRNHEIGRSKLIKLWNAEGFLEPSSTELALGELVSRSLVMVLQRRSILSYRSSTANDIKTCSLHPVFWHLCNREAEKNKFSHIVSINSCSGIEQYHRRLCIHNNVIFANKDVHKSIASVSNARSLLCTGPPHQFPVPLCSGLRLLRVLDALTIRLYEFPLEVVKLVQLRYLALTCNENLPSSISKLRSLEYLIILRHLSIVASSGSNSSYLPMEIWEMQELKHLQVTGSNLPDHRGAILPNLLALLDVSPHCCTKELLERIPALRKLRIRFDLDATSTRSSDYWFDLLSSIRLRSFKCVTLNPIPTSEIVSLPAQLRENYSGVVKLSLSGFGYPWEYMRVVGSLWGLQVLKLQCNAFRGPKWETPDKAFRSLKVLVVEDSDLMHWTAGIKTFRCLERVTMKRCHRLEEIPADFGGFRVNVELVDCNSVGVAFAARMEEELRKQDRHCWLQVSVRSSSME